MLNSEAKISDVPLVNFMPLLYICIPIIYSFSK